MRIIVIDDEPALCTLISGLLRAEGHEVRAFHDPQAAVGLIPSSQKFDLFLIDLILPGPDGVAVAGHLNGMGFEDTPKVAMSASRAHLRAAMDSGLFSDTLDKPFDFEELCACLERSTPAYRYIASA